MKSFAFLLIFASLSFQSCATRVRNSKGIMVFETYGNWSTLTYEYKNGKESSKLAGQLVNHSQPTTAAFNGSTKLVGGIASGIATAKF